MRSTTFAVAVIVALAACHLGSASAKECHEDDIETVSDNGDILKMISGHIYEVDDTDTVDTQLWLASEEVLVCEEGSNIVQIINTDSNGEKALATRLR